MRSNEIKTLISRITPRFIKNILGRVRRLFIYRQYDSSQYWRQRATEPGQKSVLWANEEYNNLYRKDQRGIIQETLRECAETKLALDIGCGIGVIAKMLTDLKPNMRIDAVDFNEMINIAKECNSHRNINYISSSAEDYFDKEKNYDFIISSACFSAIRNINSLEKALDNSARMVRSGGLILMIDPFHRWNYLARAKYNTRNVVAFMKARGYTLEKKSGIIIGPIVSF